MSVPNRAGDYGRRADENRPSRSAVGERKVAASAVDSPDALVWPRANRSWNPTVKRLYAGIKSSGQAAVYEPSDVALAYFLAEELDAYMQPTPVKDRAGNAVLDDDGNPKMYRRQNSQVLAALLGGLGSLGVDEMSRRRMRLDLTKPDTSSAQVQAAAILEYKKRLGVIPADA